ncbi:nucleotidyltransferase family protein [Patescibacteria group bacterium]|nr:nucleotidyltransferase family protein [Patescibacteria group bacterium]
MIQDGRVQAVKVGRNYIIERATLQENFIGDIKKIILPILKKHGVKKAAIFGSVARGQRRKNSDLDLLVEYGKRKTLLDFVGLKLELEEKLGMKVDLGQFDTIYHLLKDQILNEAVPIL